MDSAREFIFTWKIRNFSFEFYKCGEAIDSPIFEANNFGGSQWCLRMFPNGEGRFGMFSLYLCKKKNDIYSEKSSLSFKIELMRGSNNLSEVNSGNHVFKLNEHFGFKDHWHSCNFSYILNKWPGNVFTVRCHMFNNNISAVSSWSLDCEICSEIPVNRNTFLWNVILSDVSSKSTHKDFHFTDKSLYELSLSKPDDTVKIRLIQKEENEPLILISCKLSLVKSNGNVLQSKSDTHLFKTNDKADVWELTTITTAELYTTIDSSGTYSFSLFCEFAASEGIKPAITSSRYGKTKMEGNSTILKDLKAMLLNNIHSDIKLKVEKEEMQAHKSILASRSPVFLAMFEQNMIESQTGVISIPDSEAGIMKLFLEYLYTDRIEKFDYESAKKLFVVADKYQVSSLVKKCAAFLESSLSLENAMEIISVADRIDHERLKKAAINFITINAVFIFNTSKGKQLLRENAQLAGEIISNIVSDFRILPNN